MNAYKMPGVIKTAIGGTGVEDIDPAQTEQKLMSSVMSKMNDEGKPLDAAMMEAQNESNTSGYAYNDDVVQKVKDTITQQQQDMQNQATGGGAVNNITAGLKDLVHKLNAHYAKENMDFQTALKVWAEAKINPDRIRQQIANDVDVRINIAESKLLHKVGHDMISGWDKLGKTASKPSPTNPELLTKRTVKLTPSVRNAVERVGRNLFRTKQANILWKIDLKKTDDGSNVPYLVRLDSVEAGDEQKKRDGRNE